MSPVARFVRRVRGAGRAFLDPSLVADEPRDLAERGQGIQRVSAERIDEPAKRPGSRILDGQFTAVQQAVGTARTNTAGAKFLHDCVEEAKKSGLVARLIERHGVVGRLSVAPPA